MFISCRVLKLQRTKFHFIFKKYIKKIDILYTTKYFCMSFYYLLEFLLTVFIVDKYQTTFCLLLGVLKFPVSLVQHELLPLTFHKNVNGLVQHESLPLIIHKNVIGLIQHELLPWMIHKNVQMLECKVYKRYILSICGIWTIGHAPYYPTWPLPPAPPITNAWKIRRVFDCFNENEKKTFFDITEIFA